MTLPVTTISDEAAVPDLSEANVAHENLSQLEIKSINESQQQQYKKLFAEGLKDIEKRHEIEKTTADVTLIVWSQDIAEKWARTEDQSNAAPEPMKQAWLSALNVETLGYLNEEKLIKDMEPAATVLTAYRQVFAQMLEDGTIAFSDTTTDAEKQDVLNLYDCSSIIILQSILEPENTHESAKTYIRDLTEAAGILKLDVPLYGKVADSLASMLKPNKTDDMLTKLTRSTIDFLKETGKTHPDIYVEAIQQLKNEADFIEYFKHNAKTNPLMYAKIAAAPLATATDIETIHESDETYPAQSTQSPFGVTCLSRADLAFNIFANSLTNLADGNLSHNLAVQQLEQPQQLFQDILNLLDNNDLEFGAVQRKMDIIANTLAPNLKKHAGAYMLKADHTDIEYNQIMIALGTHILMGHITNDNLQMIDGSPAGDNHESQTHQRSNFNSHIAALNKLLDLTLTNGNSVDQETLDALSGAYGMCVTSLREMFRQYHAATEVIAKGQTTGVTSDPYLLEIFDKTKNLREPPKIGRIFMPSVPLTLVKINQPLSLSGLNTSESSLDASGNQRPLGAYNGQRVIPRVNV